MVLRSLGILITMIQIIHGAVEAIRIFYSENATMDVLAELRFCFGGTTIIEWTNPTEREKFAEGINGYAKMRLEETEGILKAQLKREEYQVNQLNDEYSNTIKIYKDYQDQILATKGIIDHNLTVLLEDASNHAIQIHQRLKNAEEIYDNIKT